MTDTQKLWGGRFATSTHELVDQLNASLPFDRRFARQDIAGSIAHATMLGEQGIIPTDDAARINEGLRAVYKEIVDETFEYRLADEDIHMAVEGRLRQIIGQPSGMLHTARSRNDQAILDLRLWLREATADLLEVLLAAIDAMLDLAAAHPDAIMPGYTHMQRAQPVLFAHHIQAYGAMLMRDCERLSDAYKRINVMPLGAGALAGVTHPIDRDRVAELLGFPEVSLNSMDTVADRDFVLEPLFAMSLIAMHLSRLAEELILWSTAEFGFVEFDDAFSTGSSIMPQKKNADIAELMRGKAGRVYGALVGLLTATKGLPLTYNKDLQEDKEGLFDSIDTVTALLAILPPMLQTLTINQDRMAEAAIGGFSLATDVADELARRGVPFREAHEVVGQLVAQCIREGRTLESLTPGEWADVHEVLSDPAPTVTLDASVQTRDIPGGTAPNQVASAREHLREQAANWRQVLETWRDCDRQVDQLLGVMTERPDGR